MVIPWPALNQIRSGKAVPWRNFAHEGCRRKVLKECGIQQKQAHDIRSHMARRRIKPIRVCFHYDERGKVFIEVKPNPA